MAVRAILGLVVVACVLVFFSCRGGGRSVQAPDEVQGPVNQAAGANLSQQTDASSAGRPAHVSPLGWATAAGREFNQRFQRKLRHVLREEGFQAAARVCGSEVDAILGEVGSEFGVRIGRSSIPSHVWRAGHRPSEWQIEALNDFEAAIRAGGDPQRQVRVIESGLPDGIELRLLHGVRLEPLCTACHGVSPHPDATAAMDNLFPGYPREGLPEDALRGVLWVELPARR